MTREEIIRLLDKGSCKMKYRYNTCGRRFHFDLNVTRNRKLIPAEDRISYRMEPTHDPILAVYSLTKHQWMLLFWNEIYELTPVNPRKKQTNG